MKIMTVVGARPQFIKEAVVSRELRKRHNEILVHTGQHYDYNMSERFFEELEIPKPDFNLGISGGTHADMTARMMISLEKTMQENNPEWLLLYGDTNSTLAAALVAAKLHVPICHVEAGVRTHCMTNPEEINRICTDHVSTLLLAATDSSMIDIVNEGLTNRAVLVGDPMFDAFQLYKDKIGAKEIVLNSLDGEKIALPDEYYYLTCHREENTEDDKFFEILSAMNSLDAPTVYPVHPRNHDRVFRVYHEKQFENVILTEPVGYLESLCLVNNAKKIVTDSGGLQREAFFARKQCVTILDFVCWAETMVDNRNQLSRPLKEDILRCLSTEQQVNENYKPFGDGHSAVRIVEAIENHKEME